MCWSLTRTGRFISPDSPGNLGVGEALTSFNLYTYCGNNPVMGYDPMGTWNWNTFFSGVGLVVMGVTAVVTAGMVLTCSGTGMLMALVASYTIVAGGITAANGAAEIIEAATDFNPVRDTIFMGSEEAYEGIKNIFKAHAEIGTMICGAYMGINGGNVCFVEGTLVSTEAGQIPIEAVVPGMLVWATDPETGETALKPVVQTFVNQTNELVHVTVNGETITCTNEHPFYSPQKGWIAACQLRAGDVLVMLNGEYVVVEQVQHELLESPATVYNFEVADLHTYYVGDTEVLVHNTCGQNHHAISNKINREKIKNHNLDCISRNDPRFQVRALTPEGHRGYQRWHRDYDAYMAQWLRDNPDATADAFINKLNDYYAKHLQPNFGKVNFKL